MSGPQTTATDPAPRTTLVRGASLTLLLIALNLLAFAYQATLTPEQRDLFILRWSVVPMEVFEATDLEPTVPFPIAGTLLSALFLHADLAHLLINMGLLLAFGPLIERRVGFWRALVIFLAGGLLGGLAQIAANPLTLASLLGASGAIAALIGAALIVPRASYHTLIMVAWGSMQAAGLFDAMVNTRWISGGLAIWSHLGGLVAGALLMLIWRRYSRGP
jgi:membrane associated rhomboid family serine protease